jgi:Domain of unknown function (DUF1906)
VTDSRTRLLDTPRTLLAVALVALAGGLALPAVALGATKVVRYHGVRVTVPASWPVLRLGADSTVCVRFNRHAVYLGVPGTRQLCPVQAVGRTEAILISPEGSSAAAGGALTPVSVLGAAPADGSMARMVEARRHVVITATWNRDPAAIRMALGLRSLRAAMLATNGHPPAVARAPTRPRTAPRETSATSPATPGEVYSGPGFDTCTTPSQSSMSAWGSASPFGAVGIYIGGTNAACLGGNLNASWVATESAAGWHMIPTYVGLQAPNGSSGCGGCATISTAEAASEGTAAAQDAVAQAQALGFGAGNPIYYDMEGYNTETAGATTAVLTFLEAWTEQLHASGYLSGVYSSAASGITELVDQYGTSYVEPDDIWIADWSDPDGTQTTADPYVPVGDWANNQRLHQYAGAQNEDYGGVKINVDSDYLGGATAAAGSAAPSIPAAPSIAVSPQPDGSIDLAPEWVGEPGITEYQILGGDSATAMTSIATAPSTQTAPVIVDDVYAYFEVQALNSAGAVVGTSAAVPTPPSVAIFGAGAFVSARGSVGIPATCLDSSFCQLTAAIYDGKRRLTEPVTKTMSIHGGVIRLALTERARAIVADAARHRLPVRVTVVSRDGMKATRTLTLNQYTVSGTAARWTTKTSSMLQILGKADFVSNGWAGGILAVCTASAPCNAATRITTRSGAVIATARAQTLGAGEIGYLWFTMTAKGHALLKASEGNQLGVRVAVTTAATSDGSGGSTVGRAPVARTLLSLDSY